MIITQIPVVNFQSNSAGSSSTIVSANSADSDIGGSEQYEVNITSLITQTDTSATLTQTQTSNSSQDYIVYPVAITVIEFSNLTPTANIDNATTNVDTAVTVDLTSNDSDPENDTLTVLQTNYPSNGSTVNYHDGTVTYTPDSGFTGTDNFDYLVTDISGTTHFWGLDGAYDGNDSIGSSSASVNGDPTVISGVFGDAMSFDEVDDHVQVPDFSYNDDFSVSFSFKVAANSGGDYQYIYSHGAVSTQNSLNIYLIEDSHVDGGTLRTNFADSNDVVNTGTSASLDFDASSFIDNQWHTYTLTVSSNGASVYLDGQLKSSNSSQGGDAFNPGTDLYLAAREDLDAARFYGGALDSVQTFGRALSSSEAAKVHSGATDSATVTVTVNATPVISDQSLVFINEIHYDNDSGDVGEAIEIAGPAGLDVTGWKLVLYNGSGGGMYDTLSPIDLSGSFTNQNYGYGVQTYYHSGIQNALPMLSHWLMQITTLFSS